ncbi:hypothetical protein EXIGLDRAFT_732500 [Exidia glandulosa HHB12029]|uniref:Uncharacterized protein n=1 Tax=Exidia glandulosa HHB12029 TaxID=1314781 RepID=A0A165KQL0_EXIGL|nr:hypothetical protein EXIGLDRAFT_732500 [Exidia glandulosa HHB12029]
MSSSAVVASVGTASSVGSSEVHAQPAGITSDAAVSSGICLPTDVTALLVYAQRQPSTLHLSLIAPVIRAASASALNIPSAHDAAVLRLRTLFPDEPRPGTYEGHDAATIRDLLALRIPNARLNLLITCRKVLTDVLQTLRPLTYAQLHTPEANERVLEALIDRFTPALFTMPAARHMKCTDRIVHEWDERVLQPALALNGAGLSAPIETLERIKGIPWTDLGICSSCVDSLKDEWTGLQVELWDILGRTLDDGAA